MSLQGEFLDALGTPHRAARGAVRIASLVPSITELVCDLGLAPHLVARTGFCIHPRNVVRDIPKVGGTKDVDLQGLRALAPTHVIVNIDENEKPVVDEIARFVPHVIVTHPLAPQDNLALYRLIGGVFGAAQRAEVLCHEFETAFAEAQSAGAGLPRAPVLYLIWKDPWMTVARDTYISRTLAVLGWDTLPADAARRYPEVDLFEAAAEAELVMLSSEPFMFRAPHVAALQAQFDARYPGDAGAACTNTRIAAHPPKRAILVDGEMTSWYGSRAIQGLRYLAALRAGCYKSPHQPVGQSA